MWRTDKIKNIEIITKKDHKKRHIHEKTLSEKQHEYNKKFKKEDWYNKKEKLTTFLEYKPTSEIVKITIEGRGGLNKDIRDIIIFSGFDWLQHRLLREPIKED